MNSDKIIDNISNQGLLPLFYHPDIETCKKVLKSLYNSGIQAVEYTNRGDKALENYEKLILWSRKNLRNFQLGIGTIKNQTAAEAFLNVGADFLISPGYDEGVASTAKKEKVLWIPGCMTPTEVMHAENEGFNFVKIFPGNVVTSNFIKAVKSVCPNVTIMPTGGVTPQKANLQSWFEAGVDAVGMGSQLIRKDLLQHEDYDEIRNITKRTLALIKAIKEDPTTLP